MRTKGLEMGINVVLKKIVLGAGLLAGYSFAAPANPMPFTVDNQGDSVTLQRAGDEHYSFTRTSDGFLVLRQDDGVYYYADENGAATKFKAKNAEHRSDSEKAFLKKLNKDASFKSHRKNTPDRFKRPAGKAQRAPWVPTGDTSSSATGTSAGISTTGTSAASSSSDSDAHPVLRLPAAEKHANGTNRFPILLVQGVGATNMDSAKASNIFNQEGYSSSGYIGSVRDYFVDQSSGKFVPTFDVYMVSVSKSASSYKNDEGTFVAEAIAALKSKYPSFDARLYDADGNGEVDAVGLIFAGSDQQANGMGGFQYELRWDKCGRQDAGNGKRFNSYFIISQQTYMFAGVLHEFSHTMGLKDHYCVRSNDCYNDFTNTEYQAPGAYLWDVMATGMYNGSGVKPPNYSAFEREFMGWLNYTTLSASSSVTSIESIDKSNMAYKIPVTGNNNEWFVLENRQANKWDSGLPNHGMLVWHIDFNQTAWDNDALNDDKTHQRIDVVEAGNVLLRSYYDSYKTQSSQQKDDSFPGSQNVTSYGPFKSWNGTNLNISLYSITEQNNLICFATQSGVTVGDCVIPSSSSIAVVQSSSSAASSSSLAASSSSVVGMSSSIVSAIPAAVYKSQVQLMMHGSVLDIATATSGPKKLELFDMLGNKLYATDFFGARHSVGLAPFAGKVLVVRVTENGKLLKQDRITVK